MVTSRDVARMAGVSQSTVSRVLNGSSHVRPETRELVLRALANYTPNANARAMRTNRTGTIGVVFSDVTNPYFPELLEAVCLAASGRGLNVVLWNEHDPATPTAVAGVQAGMVDGVLFTSATEASSAIGHLVARPTPVVLVNRALATPLCDQVASNNTQIGRIAANYLLEAGVDRIGTIFGPAGVYAGVERRSSFVETLWSKARIEVPPHWTIHGELDFETGYRAVHEIFTGGSAPRALFCGNDIVGFGAVSGLRELGIRVPEDVWIIGVDDLSMSAWAVFDLTTIRQPIQAMADRAVEILHARINGDDSPLQDITLDAELVVRGSTANSQPRHPSGAQPGGQGGDTAGDQVVAELARP